ncbi:hypothetical protein E4T42_06705 [Aureobasidium subglaciale]|nr:hypothetical protein E4T42_06705 [Aureobasidium subglaciale]
MVSAFLCTLCNQAGTIKVSGSTGNMKVHLGSAARGCHNMGPWVCQVAGCNERAARADRINQSHGTGNAMHIAQFVHDQGLAANIAAETERCRLLYIAAQTAGILPAPAPAPAPILASIPAPAHIVATIGAPGLPIAPLHLWRDFSGPLVNSVDSVSSTEFTWPPSAVERAPVHWRDFLPSSEDEDEEMEESGEDGDDNDDDDDETDEEDEDKKAKAPDNRETYEDEGWRAFRLPVFVRESSPAPSPLPATKPGLRDAFRAPTIYVYKDIGFDRYRVEAIEKTKLPQYNKVDKEDTVDQLSPHSQYILDTENGAIFDSDAEDDDHGTYSTDNEVSKTDGIETQHGSIMDHFEDTRGTIGGIHRGSSAAVGDAVQPDLSSNPTIQFFQNSIKSSGNASNVDLFFQRPAIPTQVHDSGTHHHIDNASIIDNSQQQAATVTQDVREEPMPLHIRKRKQIASRSFATDRNVRPQINHYHGYETGAGDILPPTSTATVILQEYIEEIQYMLRHEIMSWPVNNHLRPLLIRLHADCGSCQRSKLIKQDLLPLLLRLKDYYRIVLDEGIEDMDRISADLDGPASMLSNPSLNVYRAIDGLAPIKYSNNALRAILARAEHCTQCMLRLSFLERRVSELG